MSWSNLLFMHWPVKVSVLRDLVPANLEIDVFDGEAWLGVIPFLMSDVRPRFAPSVLAFKFPELNVRTYVRHKQRAGVWFFSLDAASSLAVWTARRFYHLPYQFAKMSTFSRGEFIEYQSRRMGVADARLRCQYRPVGAPVHFRAGTLDSWLTDRYCLFATNRRSEIFRGDIHHEPWPLQPAEVEIETNTMTSPLGLVLPRETPLVHFAKHLDVRAWSLVRSGAPAADDLQG
jgi:uncharacterized protein YqjF (DUF2071 family)